MNKKKWLDGNFKETKRIRDVCYIIGENGVELCALQDTEHPIITKREILKLAEILKEENEK